MRGRWLGVSVWALVGMTATGAHAQVRAQFGGVASGKRDAPAPPADQALSRSADDAKRLIDEKQWVRAVPAVQQIFDRPEDGFLASTENVWTTARRAAERWLIEKPELLAEYRRQYDDEAKAALDAAGDRTDALALTARRFFFATAGAATVDRLAANLLDRGDAALAASYWERLRESPAHRAADGGALRAKLAVALALAGEPAAAKRIAAPGAPTTVAGRRTTAAELLAALQPPGGPEPPESAWPMPGGAATHSGVAQGDAPLLIGEVAAASRKYLENDDLKKRFAKLVAHNRGKRRPLFVGSTPIVVGEVAYIRTQRGVEAIRLADGRPAWPNPYTEGDPLEVQDFRFNEWESGRGVTPTTFESLVFGNTLYGTLTSDGGRLFCIDELYVQPGSLNFFFAGRERDVDRKRDSNRLTCLDLATGKPLWRLGGKRARERNEPAGYLFFFGPPTPYAGKLYALAETKSEVGLYEIDPANGAVLWHQPLLLMNRKIDVDPYRRSQCCHLAIAGGIAVCSTNTQKLFAVDLVSKTLLWERDFESDLASDRRLLNLQFVEVMPPPENPYAVDPPIIVDGKVLASSSNWRSLHCLDLRTGTSVWSADRTKDHSIVGAADGAVVLVGADRVRALELADRTLRWTKAIDMPAGRGVIYRPPGASDGSARPARLLLPMEAGGALVVRMADGVRENDLGVATGNTNLGNVALSASRLVAIGGEGVRMFPLVSHARREAAALLAQQPNHPRGLYLSAILAAADRKPAEARTAIERCLDRPEDFPERTQAVDLGVELAEQARELPACERLVELLARRAADPAHRSRVGRLQAELALAKGNERAAVEAALAHLELQDGVPTKATADRAELSPRAWTRAFVGKAFAELGAKRRGELEAELRKTLAKSPPKSLAHSAYALARTGLGQEMYLAAAHQAYKNRGADYAEHAALAAVALPGPPESAVAGLSLLATLASEGDLPEDARPILERWRERYREVADREGMSADRRLAALSPLPPPPTGLWATDVVTSPDPTPSMVSNDFQGMRQWCKILGECSPFLTRHSVVLESTGPSQSLKIVNYLTGKAARTVALEGTRGGFFTGWGEKESAAALGHTVYIAHGKRLSAVSVLGAQSKPLWSKPLAAEAASEDEAEVFEDDDFSGNPTYSTPAIGPVGAGFVAVRLGGAVTVLDSATGEFLWRRAGLQNEDAVFGDDECLGILQPTDGLYRLYDPRDGTQIRAGKWTWAAGRGGEFPIVGRRFVRTNSTKDGLEVSLWDALFERALWVRRFANGARRASETDDERLVVVEPDRKLTVIDQATGATTFQTQLPESAAASIAARCRIRVLVEEDRAFVAVDRERTTRSFGSTLSRLHSAPVNGLLSAYRLADGKPLWERRLNEARLIHWPLQESPFMLAISNSTGNGAAPFAGLGNGEQSRQVEAIHKDSGKTYGRTNAGTDFAGAAELSFEATAARSYIVLRGWQSRLRWEFRPPPQPRKKGEPTLDDVGDIAGKLFKLIGEEKAAGKKKK